MIPSRPKINDAEADKIANYFFPKSVPELLVIGIRGYFLNSVGKKNENDYLWDDAVVVYENGTLIKTFNGNTDPSKHKSDLAMLDTGVYHFAKGTHKKRIKAFRAFPEGVRLKCRRENSKGVWKESLCSAINFHDGGLRDTWSAGCQTIINQGKQKQFDEFRDLVYRLMTKHKVKTFTYLLITESQMQTALHGEVNELVSTEKYVPEIKKVPAAVPAIIPPTDSPSEKSDAQFSDSPAAVESPNVNESSQTEPPSDITGDGFKDFGEQIGGFVEEQTENVEGAMSKTEETVTRTIETEEGKVEKTVSEITDKFDPKNIPAFIPRFGKQWLIGLIPGAGFVSTIIAYIENAPQWLIFLFGALTGIALWNFFGLIIRHRQTVCEFLVKCYETTANPQMHNLIPTPAKEYVGFRRNELFSTLGAEKK